MNRILSCAKWRIGSACIAALSLGACVDDAYDLGKDIDTSVSIDVDKLTMPASKVEPLTLTNLLGFDDYDDIDTVTAEDLKNDPVRFVRLKQGDYYFTNRSKKPTRSTVKVEPVTAEINNPGEGTSQTLEFAAANLNQGEALEKAYIQGTNIEIRCDDVTNELKELHWLEGTMPVSIDLWYASADASGDADMPNYVTLEKGLQIKFPKYIKIDGNPDEVGVMDGNTIVTKKPIRLEKGKHATLNLNVTNIDCTGMTPNTNDKNWGLYDVDMNGPEAGSFLMEMDVEIEGITSLTSDAFSYGVHDVKMNVRSSFQTGSLHMQRVNGLFEPKDGYADIDPVDIDDLPDFMTDEETKLVVSDPRITFYYMNEGLKDMEIKLLEVYITPVCDGNPVAANRIRLENVSTSTMEGENSITYVDNYTGNVTPSLSKLVDGRMPEQVQFTMGKTQLVGTIEMDHEYQVSMEYEMMAPFALGEGSRISYEETMDGLNGDIVDMYENTEIENAVVELELHYVNTIPINMTISQKDIVVIDKDGNQIDDVAVVAEASIKAGLPEKPESGSFKIKLNQQREKIDRFDGLKLKFVASVDGAHKDITLNTRQRLQIDTMTMTVSGSVTIKP